MGTFDPQFNSALRVCFLTKECFSSYITNFGGGLAEAYELPMKPIGFAKDIYASYFARHRVQIFLKTVKKR